MSNEKPQVLSIEEFMTLQGNQTASIQIEKTENGVIFTLSAPNVYRRKSFEGTPTEVAKKVQKAVADLITG